MTRDGMLMNIGSVRRIADDWEHLSDEVCDALTLALEAMESFEEMLSDLDVIATVQSMHHELLD